MSCGAASSYLAYLVKFDEIHLELADLRVKGERVKEHRVDESYVSRLAEKKKDFHRSTEKIQTKPVIDPLPPIYPEPSQLGEDVDHPESLEVVDEDVRDPQAVDQLKVH